MGVTRAPAKTSELLPVNSATKYKSQDARKMVPLTGTRNKVSLPQKVSKYAHAGTNNGTKIQIASAFAPCASS